MEFKVYPSPADISNWLALVAHAPEYIRDILSNVIWVLVLVLFISAIFYLLFRSNGFLAFYAISMKVALHLFRGLKWFVGKMTEGYREFLRQSELVEPYPRVERAFRILGLVHTYAMFWTLAFLFLTILLWMLYAIWKGHPSNTGLFLTACFAVLLCMGAKFFLADAQRQRIALFPKKSPPADHRMPSTKPNSEPLKP